MGNLSIIVINKNREKTLQYCLNAIKSQMECNDELIVVDDCSTDHSLSILEELSNAIDRIIHVDTKGNRSVVRNTGAKAAKNDILVFIDSDVIIGPRNLEFTRMAYEDSAVVGTTGNVAGNSCDESQFEIIVNKKPEVVLAEFLEDFNGIKKYYKLFDYRYNNFELTMNTKDNWPFYYTSYASARKEAFDQVGGYDECFSSWGSEDIEFGYRLNKLGDIVHINDCVAFHYPHKKNFYDNSFQNINNLYYILKKYQNLEFEIYTAFLGANRSILKEELKKMYDYVSNEEETPIELADNELVMYFSSKQYPNGRIDYCIDQKEKRMELFGFAIPIVNRTFDTVYLSKKCRLLPETIFCKVMQEALRLGGKVLLEKGELKQTVYNEVPIFGNSYPLLFGVTYISERYLDFEFVDYNGQYTLVQWSNNARIDKEKNIFSI